MTTTSEHGDGVVVAQPGPAEKAQLEKVGVPPSAVDSGGNGPPQPGLEKTPAQAKEEADKAAALAAKNKEKTPEQLRADAAAAKEAADKAAKDAEAATTEERKDWVNQYVEIDHPAAQAAIDLLAEAGVSPLEANGIFEDAIRDRDISKVKWSVLEAKIGKAKTQLVKSGVTQYDNEVVAKVRQNVADAHAIVGSQENWDKITTWAKAREKTDKVFAGQLQEYRAAVELGGWALKQAVTALKDEFNKDPKTNGLGNAKIVAGQTVATTVEGALTRADYVSELKKAHERNASPTEIKALDARRMLGKQQGI